MSDEPNPLEIDLGEPPPGPGRKLPRWPLLGVAVVALLALVDLPEPGGPAEPPPAVEADEPVADDATEEATAEEAPVRRGRREAPPEPELKLLPAAELAYEPPPPPPPVEPLTEAVEESQDLLQAAALLLARNTQAAEEAAIRALAVSVDTSTTTFRKAHTTRIAARDLRALAKRLDGVDVQADPYGAARLVIDALERLDTAGALKEAEVAKLNRVAGALGDLGEHIVEARDEGRYPLARRALESANRWSARADGAGEYDAALAELDLRAIQAVTREQARGGSPEAVAAWAPTGGGAAAQIQALRSVGGGG